MKGTRLLAKVAWLAVVLGASTSVVQSAGTAAVARSAATVALASGRYVLTPYVSADGESVVVHAQASGSAGAETLLDARSGAPWTGSPKELMVRFKRLDVETPAQVAAGGAFDQRMLQQLGCVAPQSFCTSPADAEVVLMMRWQERGALALEVVDLRRLLGGMDLLMAGHKSAPELSHADDDWQLLKWAAADAQRRARWLEAVRSIDDAPRWQRLAAAAESGPRLLQWPSFAAQSDDRRGFDLAAELELSALRLNVSQLARAAIERPGADQLRALADALLLGNQVGFRGDVTSQLVDVLIQHDASLRLPLAQALAAEARRRRVHGLWCYAEWMSARPCAGSPPWETRTSGQTAGPVATPGVGLGVAVSPAASPIPTAPNATAGAAPRVVSPTNRVAGRAPASNSPVAQSQPGPNAAVATGPSSAAPAGASTAGDAQQEWVLLQSQANKQALLAYSETSGHMTPESSAVLGLSFVARSLGPLQEGRFEVQTAPNGRAPLLLRHGTYRVRVRLVLDYAREDRCSAGVLCLFSSAERYARTERRDLNFVLTPSNGHTEKQRAEFGGLVPRAPDGGARYTSTLKEARLAIESVRFDLK